MSEFVGRTGSKRVYSYPETPRGGGLAALARNYASGPLSEGTIFVSTTPGSEISWASVDVPGVAPQDVPITPRVSGVIRVSGVVTVRNGSANPADVQLQVEIQIGASLPFVFLIPEAEHVTIDPNNVGEGVSGFEAIPFLVELINLDIGVTANIRVLLTALTASTVVLVNNSSTIEVQEVLPATG